MSKRPRAARVPQEVLQRLAELTARREPAVLVTVAEASGSAPGKAGAKMVVTGDRAWGTVGGGRVENAALTVARELLGSRSGPRLVRYDVVQDLGMSCGGTMRVLFEPMTPPPRLVIFGAGHISESLCAVASLIGFDVTVCDEREEWLTQERFPAARKRVLGPLAEAVTGTGINADTFVASVTPGHAFDLQVVRALFAADLEPRYLGVIGSRRKAIQFRKELVEAGIPRAGADAVRIPMGLDIGAADPPEIAVSIAAELVAVLRSDDSAGNSPPGDGNDTPGSEAEESGR